MVTTFRIDAEWDPEADVWVATSDDVPGLATEAASLDELAGKLRVLVPELLELNGVTAGGETDEIAFELTGHRRERVRLAS